MQTQKMSLANIKGKLSRAEMKNIMAGSGTTPDCGNITTNNCSNCPTGCACPTACTVCSAK